MTKYATFPSSVNPVRKGWYQTQVGAESWGSFYNYWNGENWSCSLLAHEFGNKLRMKTQSSQTGSFLYNRNFYWRGILK